MSSLSRRAFVGGSVAAALAGAASAGAAAPTGAGVSSSEAIRRLRDGNARFVSGNLLGTLAEERRLAFRSHQAPFATILSCSDSRVPPELIFDQHIGDLFVVRVAGNFVGPGGLATIEYGFSALGSRLVMVLGHEGCGAIKATVDAIRTGTNLPPHLRVLQEAIAPGIRSHARSGTYEAAVVANVRAEVATLERSQPVLAGAVADHRLTIVGAKYALRSGTVSFLA